MPKFAANLSFLFNEVPFIERFAAAAASGFRGVEYLFPYEEDKDSIARALRDNGLENVLFNLPPGDWAAGERGLGALPGREQDFRDGVSRALDYALAAGTKRLHALAGIVPNDADRDRCRQTFIANLRYACEQLAPHGITLLIEPINTRDMPGYFLNYQKDAHGLLAEVGAPNLKVQMDFYHAQIMEGDIISTFRRYLSDVGHVQIASVPERHEPDLGELNYPWLFAMMDEAGYDGWIGCEYRPRESTTAGLGWLQPYQVRGDDNKAR
jgi:2-dehydrotetronate isomerase